MAHRSAQRVAIPTRDRILDAAVLRFSRHSYEAVGLRDIAADAGVDVAYVHRCFGSKAQLFAEAVGAIVQGDRILADVEGDPGGALAKQLFAHDNGRARESVRPLDIVVHSLSSPEASRILREHIVSDFIDPLARKLHHRSSRQSALIAAFLLGAGILRNVLRIDDLCEATGGALEREIAEAIKAIARDVPRRQVRVATSSGRKATGAQSRS